MPAQIMEIWCRATSQNSVSGVMRGMKSSPFSISSGPSNIMGRCLVDRFDCANLPIEIWCDALEEFEGIATDDLRAWLELGLVSDGYRYGDGYGDGYGYGYGNGYGDGDGNGNGYGDGDGYGYGNGNGY